MLHDIPSFINVRLAAELHCSADKALKEGNS
jgi:hypothetical protein